MIKLGLKLLALSALIYSHVLPAYEPTETAGWFVDSYGVAPDTQLTNRVNNIYKKVKRAGANAPINSQLVIVKGGSAAWAVALPDGNIIISADTIDIAYRGVDVELGDARIAFILGHELAHQTNRDFWHQKLTMSGEGASLAKKIIANAAQPQSRFEKEIKADELGFINAALAGYRTDRLLGNDDVRSSFIEYWVDQTGTVSPTTHPAAADRSAMLRTRLSALESKAELFKYGVRLAHFGLYEDALQFLIAFEREYPSREVLNNLGYVYLQTARQEMPQDIAYRFWFPMLLENHSGLSIAEGTRSWLATPELSEEVLQKLTIAQQYLQRAVDMDSRDIVSRANLIAVNLYLGKPGAARDLVEEAAAIKPGDTQIMGLRALVLYQQEPGIDTWSRAKKILEPLSKLDKVEHNIIYNYSRLLEERGRDGAALKQWARLSEQLSQLPFDYQVAVCRQIDSAPCKQMPSSSSAVANNDFWSLPLKHGDDVDDGQSRSQTLNWQKSASMQVGTVNTRLLISPEANSMLALDNKIELAVLKKHGFSSSKALRSAMGEPMVRYPLASGEIWSYGERWSALVDNDKVQEIWIARP